MSKNWDIKQQEDTTTESAILFNFVKQSQGEAVTSRIRLTVRASGFQIADAVCNILQQMGQKPIQRADNSTYIAVESNKCLAIISGQDRQYNNITDDYEETTLSEIEVAEYNILIAGSRTLIAEVNKSIRVMYKEEKHAKVKWYYRSERGTQSQTIFMPSPATILRPEFYPDIANPQEYIKSYPESDSSVLLMSGEPGTGKTTLLRHMICDHALSASIIYDEQIMQGDSVFQSFLFSKGDDALIIEDADTIICSRELDSNKLMSRFLNVSDGLIKLPNKKLIFTTNLTDFSKVDPALLRPGRCFGVLRTRPMTFDEACKAAKVAGLPLPFKKKSYTIAELFHPEYQQEERKIGFSTRGAS